MFGRKPKQNPRSYIVVLETGTFWANEFGVVSGRVEQGTFHRVSGGSNSHFAEAVLIASMVHTHLGAIDHKVGALTEEVRARGLAPERPRLESRFLRKA